MNLQKTGLIVVSFIVGAILLFPHFSHSVQAQDQDQILCKAPSNITNIYYVNGILTTPREASAAAGRLESAYKRSLPVPESVPDTEYVFSHIYNRSEDGFEDLRELFTQKALDGSLGLEDYLVRFLYKAISTGESVQDIIKMITNVRFTEFQLVNRVIQRLAQLTDAGLTEIIEKLQQLYSDAYAELLRKKSQVIAEAAFQANIYKTDLATGKRVIVIAHSQGNLHALSAVARAIQSTEEEAKKSIAIIGVASPATTRQAAEARDYYKYVTANDDRIINALRALDEDTLAGNINNDPSTSIFGDGRDLWNHEFIASYFEEGLSSRAWIDGEISRLAKTLPYPTQIAEEGAIHAVLTWGAEPDVDLHAFEPSGSHVYYGNLVGNSGELDLDDVTSYGPENYFVACDRLEIGTYRIGVNYYNGVNPERAHVQLKVGDGRSIFPRSVNLSTVRGPDGDNDPIILFTVKVSKDEDGVYEYEVE